MKKLREFYRNNRIYCILMIVSLICFIVMASVIGIHFINETKGSAYGSRLDEIENYDIDGDIKKLEDYYSKNKNVTTSDIRLQGKIIYINVTVDSKLTNEDIQNMATSSLEVMTQEIKDFVDIQYIFKREGLEPYLGSKSSTKTVIAWANYSYAVETTTTTTKKS